MTQPGTRAYIGLGSNLDDPRAQLDRAVAALAATPGIALLRVSAHYRSAPWGLAEQPEFVNAVVEVDTTLDPAALLAALLAIEQAAGRVREVRWGPRVLDLDLLTFGEMRLDTAQLQLPHPRMHERAFVLVPLAELVPDFVLGDHGRVADVLERIGREGVHALPARPTSGVPMR